LQVRERLLILPIIGVIDPQRARQLTEQLLRGIRTNRAKVVVIDITGVAAMDATVANHRACKTVGGLTVAGCEFYRYRSFPEIAQTLVNIGVDLGKNEYRLVTSRAVSNRQNVCLAYKVVQLAEAS